MRRIRAINFRYLRSTAHIWAAPSDGSSNLVSLCVRVTAEHTTVTAHGASGPPERGLFEYPYKIENGVLTIDAGQLPTPGDPMASLTAEKPPCA